MTGRVSVAIERAKDDARTLPAPPGPAPADAPLRARRVAVGDPQAPLGKFLDVLDAHDLLGQDGRLAPDVALVSMGDHFDFGGAAERSVARESGTELLAWLAAHPADQVVLLAGNHDLARVGELARFDDATFEAAQAEADMASGDERDFRARWGVPSWEVVARDFGSFRVAQRTLVTALLQTHRLRAAHAPSPDLLLTHAGVTSEELDALDVPTHGRADAAAIAASLNLAMDRAVAAWRSGALAIPGLYAAGDAAEEGRGMFYHRPARDAPSPPGRTLHRRFDPKRLPRGLTQAIGHIRDEKTRTLLGAPPRREGRVGHLRHLVVRGSELHYALGVPAPDVRPEPDAAVMLFLDGAMNDAEVADYQLLDLDTRRPAARRRRVPEP
jgi:calcineurin-like phosphoesterase family protein